MLVSDDNFLGDFCCSKLEEYSQKPNKIISFDPLWKKYDCDIPEPKMCVSPIQGMGVASQMYGGTQIAGYSQIPINYCPWCGTKLTFT